MRSSRSLAVRCQSSVVSQCTYQLNLQTRKPIAYSYPKIGTRVDGRQTSKGEDNFAEFGWAFAHQENILSQITFQNPNTKAMVCSLEAGATFQKCASGVGIGSSTLAAAGYSSTFHPSWYWNFKATVPTRFWGSSLVIDGHGDWFWSRKQQFVTETKIDSTLDVSLKLFKAGGFTLSPTYTWFAYENQNQYDHVYINQYSVKLTYNLDKRSRVSLRDAGAYGPGTTASADGQAGSGH